jgi:MFS family permease
MTVGDKEVLSASDRSGAVAGVVLAVGVSCALHVGKLPVAIPLLQVELGMSLLQAGFLLSLVQLAGMSLGLLVGLLADRVGPRRVMLAGLLVLAAGSGLGALAPSVSTLLLTRVIEGMGFLLAVLPAPGMLRLHVKDPATLSRALGWWGTYMPLGTALALLLGVPAMSWMGWRAVWVLVALVSVCAAGVLAWQVPHEQPLSGGGGTGLWTRLQRTLRAPGPWLVALGFFLYSGQWLAVIGFLPTIYRDAGLGGGAIAGLSALAAAINMTGNVAAGRWLARGAPPGLVLALAYAAMAVGALVAFGAQGHPVWQYAAILAFSALGGLIPGTLFGVAVVMAPGNDTVSTTVGWMQQFSALGQFTGPPAVAWLVTQVGGWQWTWVLTGGCSLLGIALALQMQRVWTRSQRSSSAAA